MGSNLIKNETTGCYLFFNIFDAQTYGVKDAVIGKYNKKGLFVAKFTFREDVGKSITPKGTNENFKKIA